MATVVNLPPDPSFGGGGAGAGIGALLGLIIKSRREKKEREEKALVLQQAMGASTQADFIQAVAPISKDTKELGEFVKIFSSAREQKRRGSLAESIGQLGPQPVTLPPVDLKPGRTGPIELQRRVPSPSLANIASQFIGLGEKIPSALSTRLFKAPELSLTEQVEKKRLLAKGKKTGELEARRENIKLILDAAGPNRVPLPEPGSLFSGEKAGNDARTVASLFGTAQRLAIGGETSTSNNLLAQARFLADNSREIRLRKEFDKPISFDAASKLGVPFGATLGEIAGRIPRSPEDLARATAIARGEGLGRVKAEEQIGFIGEAQSMITNLLNQIEDDPRIVGIRGSLFATGKVALGVVSDLGLSSLIEGAKNLAFEQTNMTEKEQKAILNNPTLSVLQLIENSVGLILARLRTPTGRVPVEVIKLSIADMKLRGLRQSQQVIDRLSFISNMLGGRKRNLIERFKIPQAKEVRRFRFNFETRTLEEVP